MYLLEHSNIEDKKCWLNGYDLICEYNLSWNLYVCSLYELEEKLEDFF